MSLAEYETRPHLKAKRAAGRKPARGLSPIHIEDADQQDLPTVIAPSRRRRIVFGWYGGKFSHLEWLLPLLPKSHHYCEPFSGSAAVLLNEKLIRPMSAGNE